MTLGQLAKTIATHFELSVSELTYKNRKEEIVRARHIWRTIAHVVFGYTHTDIAKFESLLHSDTPHTQARANIYHSISKIVFDGLWTKEYEEAIAKIEKLYPESPVPVNEAKTDDNGIERVTKEAFSERFYKHPEKINPRTNNNWFPSWHFLYGIGEPPNKFLNDYYKNKGWASEIEFKRAEVIGSYVHNRIEDMGKYDIDTTRKQIYRAFPCPHEARRVEESLRAWLNFVEDERPQAIAYENMLIAEDWGGTVDLRARLKSDGYENVWTIDFKTSKSVYESHKAQVESYRRTLGDDKAAVLILGNTTKKRYTFSEVKEKDRDGVYKDFLNIKETAYGRLIKAKRTEPRPDDMPEVFTLKNSNIIKEIV
ncbi:chromosomal replication initiator protein DnaA [uncultured Mediterranean phage]|nr:chromosomal replication initiator protein DnaA [uncultured Mediterranean phage]